MEQGEFFIQIQIKTKINAALTSPFLVTPVLPTPVPPALVPGRPCLSSARADSNHLSTRRSKGMRKEGRMNKKEQTRYSPARSSSSHNAVIAPATASVHRYVEHDVEDLHREFLLVADLARVDDHVEHVDGRVVGLAFRGKGDLRRVRGRTTPEDREMGANERRRRATRGASPCAQTRHSHNQAGLPSPLQHHGGVKARMFFYLASCRDG